MRDSTYLLGALKANIHDLGERKLYEETELPGQALVSATLPIGPWGPAGGSRTFREVPQPPPLSCTISAPLSSYFTPTYGNSQETASYLDILNNHQEKRGKGQVYKAPQQTRSHYCNRFIQVCVCSGGETRLRSASHCNTIRGLAIDPSLLGIPS